MFRIFSFILGIFLTTGYSDGDPYIDTIKGVQESAIHYNMHSDHHTNIINNMDHLGHELSATVYLIDNVIDRYEYILNQRKLNESVFKDKEYFNNYNEMLNDEIRNFETAKTHLENCIQNQKEIKNMTKTALDD